MEIYRIFRHKQKSNFLKTGHAEKNDMQIRNQSVRNAVKTFLIGIGTSAKKVET